MPAAPQAPLTATFADLAGLDDLQLDAGEPAGLDPATALDPLPSYEVPTDRRVIAARDLAAAVARAPAEAASREARHVHHVTGAAGSASALVVRALARRAGRKIVAVTADTETARALAADVSFVLGERRRGRRGGIRIRHLRQGPPLRPQRGEPLRRREPRPPRRIEPPRHPLPPRRRAAVDGARLPDRRALAQGRAARRGAGARRAGRGRAGDRSRRADRPAGADGLRPAARSSRIPARSPCAARCSTSGRPRRRRPRGSSSTATS